MDADWIKSPTGHRVLGYWGDPRPAWLWTADGGRLIWANDAARYFGAKGNKNKKRGARPAGTAVPIRGQVARLMRLGATNRPSLSRLQFIVADKPHSATCTCIPIGLGGKEMGLLIVAVDPVSAEVPIALVPAEGVTDAIFAPLGEYLVLNGNGIVAGGSDEALVRYADDLGTDLPITDAGEMVAGGVRLAIIRIPAGPNGVHLLFLERIEQESITISHTDEAENAPEVPVVGAEESVQALSEEAVKPWLLAESPAASLFSEVTQKSEDVAVPDATPTAEPEGADEAVGRGGLRSLFDRLADDGELYKPLDEDPDATYDEDEVLAPKPQDQSGSGAPTPTPLPPAPDLMNDQVEIAALIEAGEDEPTARPVPSTSETPEKSKTPEKSETPTLYQVTGRGFRIIAVSAPEETPPNERAALEEVTMDAGDTKDPAVETLYEHIEPDEKLEPENENVERVSRYNFDELSRILSDRVGAETSGPHPRDVSSPTPEIGAPPPSTGTGALVTLGGETLVLNRLPLGILVFRDQKVLFANRSITEMIGYDTVEDLRAAGLGAIFPSAGGEPHGAGPVNHLVQRDGALVPVTARLQSVSWQGRPALMLSASTTEVRTGHEAAVRAFAELVAEKGDDGFIEANRAGVISMVSPRAALILDRNEDQLVGRPLSQLIAGAAQNELRAFLERPARFAETARPGITLKGSDPGTELFVFAQGQAGIVTGYFGFARKTGGRALPVPTKRVQHLDADADPALLARLSRGVRRPLNTIIGFSDLIGSAAFGEIGNNRYLEYARDIKAAGQEIAALVDELDDYARLRDGRYRALPSDIELMGLLESCVVRIRGQASAARVLVRSAISEKLPKIRADRASLAQAVLNLLASAIAQTPKDGSVVLSAQITEDGGVAIRVRDSASAGIDLGERFVVFRDGVDRDGQMLAPVRSSVGLALTRSLLAVNACSLSVDPAGEVGTLFSLVIPPENVVQTP